jgi:hypothetical protein
MSSRLRCSWVKHKDAKVHKVSKGGQCKDCDKWSSYNFKGLKRKYCADCGIPGYDYLYKPEDVAYAVAYCTNARYKFCGNSHHNTYSGNKDMVTCDHLGVNYLTYCAMKAHRQEYVAIISSADGM